jgi:hypothetical protein
MRLERHGVHAKDVGRLSTNTRFRFSYDISHLSYLVILNTRESLHRDSNGSKQVPFVGALSRKQGWETPNCVDRLLL